MVVNSIVSTEETIDAQSPGLYSVLRLSQGGHHDDGDDSGFILPFQSLGDGKTIHPGHHGIQDDQVWFMLLQDFQR